MVQGEFIYEQLDADWGLSRISHLLDTYGTATQSQYLFQPEAGQNSTIYILDTGVRITHRELVGRAQWGANFANDIDEDENGHGTHVAGIAAGSDVGVAKYANIVAVKVLNKNQTGTLSNFIKGLSWIIDDVKSRPNTRAIINYSAVGEVSDARAQALQEVVDAGILFVGASGNSDTDACSFGPPNDVRVGHITAAALNFTDEPAAFTNYGPCVQVFAPGVNIRSSLNTSDDAYGIMSGSSMAAPHVAGLAAYFWSINGSLSLSDITSMITEGNQGRIINAFPDTVNKIAYNRVS
jgi:cerevisin